MNKSPVGVKFVVGFHYLLAACVAFFGVRFSLGMIRPEAIDPHYGKVIPAITFIDVFPWIVGILVVSMLIVLLGVGIFKKKNFCRVIAIVFASMAFLFSAWGVFIEALIDSGDVFLPFIGVVISVILLYYLSVEKKFKAWFVK
jgi:hypothetical protein